MSKGTIMVIIGTVGVIISVIGGISTLISSKRSGFKIKELEDSGSNSKENEIKNNFIATYIEDSIKNNENIINELTGMLEYTEEDTEILTDDTVPLDNTTELLDEEVELLYKEQRER